MFIIYYIIASNSFQTLEKLPIKKNLSTLYKQKTDPSSYKWDTYLSNITIGSYILFGIAVLFLIIIIVLYAIANSYKDLLYSTNDKYDKFVKIQLIFTIVFIIICSLASIICMIYFFFDGINSNIKNDMNIYENLMNYAQNSLTQQIQLNQSTINRFIDQIIDNDNLYNNQPILINNNKINTYFTMFNNLQETHITEYIANTQAQDFIKRKLNIINYSDHINNQDIIQSNNIGYKNIDQDITRLLNNSFFFKKIQVLIDQYNTQQSNLLTQNIDIINNVQQDNIDLMIDKLSVLDIKSIVTSRIKNMIQTINIYNYHLQKFYHQDLLTTTLNAISNFEIILNAMIFPKLSVNNTHLLNLDGINKLYDFCNINDLYIDFNTNNSYMQNFIITESDIKNVLNTQSNNRIVQIFYDGHNNPIYNINIYKNTKHWKMYTTTHKEPTNFNKLSTQEQKAHQLGFVCINKAQSLYLYIKEQSFFTVNKKKYAFCISIILFYKDNNQMVPLLFCNNLEAKIIIFNPQSINHQQNYRKLCPNILNITPIKLIKFDLNNYFFESVSVHEEIKEYNKILPIIKNIDKSSNLFIDTELKLNKTYRTDQNITEQSDIGVLAANNDQDFNNYITYITNNQDVLPYKIQLPFFYINRYIYNSNTLNQTVNVLLYQKDLKDLTNLNNAIFLTITKDNSAYPNTQTIKITNNINNFIDKSDNYEHITIDFVNYNKYNSDNRNINITFNSAQNNDKLMINLRKLNSSNMLKAKNVFPTTSFISNNTTDTTKETINTTKERKNATITTTIAKKSNNNKQKILPSKKI